MAVIDTGIDYNHEDLYRDSNGNGVLDAGEQYNVWINAGEDINHNGIVDNGVDDDGDGFIDDIRGWNFVSNNNSPMDDFGHGTHVAGIIAAVGNNTRGITGVAPMARVMAVKCLDANGSGSETNLANGIIYAADRGAHIINNSWGGSGQSQLIKSAIDYARSRNCVVVASAGNSAWNAAQFFPANVPGVLPVGALNTSSSRAYFSNYGSVVSFSAPGVDILSLRAAGTDMYQDGKHFVPSGDANAKYYRSDGTSMACPFASGVAALILGKDPSLSETAVRRVMAASAAPLADPTFYLGTGLLNAESALSVIPQVSGISAAISTPANDLELIPTNQNLGIFGTASGSSYVLEYGQGYYPITWSTISTGTMVTSGWLGTLDLSDKQGPYHIRLTVDDGSKTAVEHTVFTAEPDLHAGWPVHLGGSSFNFGGYILGSSYSATPADADGDGKDEIFLGSAGNTFGLRGDGTILPGWPTQQVTYLSYGTNNSMPGPSIADMDNDGVMEILWTLRDYWYADTNVRSFNGKKLDGSDMIGFPQQAPGQPSNAMDMPFVLADINDDGMLEAIAAHTNGNTFEYYRISAFDHLGNRLFTHDLADVNESFVALSYGDIDNNGRKDIVGISRAAYQNAPIYLHVFDGIGNEQPGYPVFLYNQTGTDMVSGPPFLADLDNDGDLEVVLGIAGSTSTIRCYHHDGTPVSGFPVSLGAVQIYNYSMGDINGDGVPEIAVLANTGSSYGVYAIALNGTLLPGFPFLLPEQPTGTPAIVDVDNDGIQDIVFTTYLGSVYAVSGNGQLINRFPKKMSYFSTSGVSVGDVDGDGLFELVTAAMNGSVYIWDLPTPASPANSDWPMRHVNRYNVNVFAALLPANNPPSAPTLVFPANGQSGMGTTVAFRWEKSTDPDGDTVAYKLSYCIDQSFAGCAPVDVASLNTIDVSYAGFGWPGLLLISMALAGNVKGRKRLAFLIIVAVIITGGILASCSAGGGVGGNRPQPSNELSYTASGLNSGATYYWKVVADDGKGGTTESAVWSFSTQ